MGPYGSKIDGELAHEIPPTTTDAIKSREPRVKVIYSMVAW
jgi:hypothetical protein